MRVITAYKVIHKKGNSPEKELNFDAGSANTAQVRVFQDWMDVKYPTWYKGGKLNKKTGVYGKATMLTKKAARKHSAEFDGAIANMGAAIGGIFSGGGSTPSTTSPTSPSGEKKAGYVWNKITGGWEKAQTGINSVMGAVNNIMNTFGANNQNAGNMPDMPPVDTTVTDDSAKKGKKNWLLIGGIVVGVGVLGYIAYKMSKRGK